MTESYTISEMIVKAIKLRRYSGRGVPLVALHTRSFAGAGSVGRPRYRVVTGEIIDTMDEGA